MSQCSNASYFDPSNKVFWAKNSFSTAVFVELINRGVQSFSHKFTIFYSLKIAAQKLCRYISCYNFCHKVGIKAYHK